MFPSDRTPAVAATACIVPFLLDPADALGHHPPWCMKFQCLALVAAFLLGVSSAACTRLPLSAPAGVLASLPKAFLLSRLSTRGCSTSGSVLYLPRPRRNVNEDSLTDALPRISHITSQIAVPSQAYLTVEVLMQSLSTPSDHDVNTGIANIASEPPCRELAPISLDFTGLEAPSVVTQKPERHTHLHACDALCRLK